MNFNKNRVVFQLGISYILILVLFITSIVVLFKLNTQVLDDLNDKYCQTIFERVINNGEKATRLSSEMFSIIVNYGKLKNIMSAQSIEELYHSDDVPELINKLSYYKKNSNIDYYLYLAKPNLVVSSGGIYTPEAYFRGFMSVKYKTKEEWLKGHKNERAIETNNGSIVFRRRYTDKVYGSADFVTTFDASFLLDVDNFPKWVKNCDIYISNIGGDIIMSHKFSDISSQITKLSQIENTYGDDWKMVENSYQTGGVYTVSVIYPKATMWEEVQRVKKTEISLTICMILLSLFATYISIKKNCSPLSRVLSALNVQKPKTEYRDYENRIREIISKNKYYVNKLYDINSQRVLARCLSKNYTPQYISSSLKEAGISFKEKYFALCELEIFDISEMYGNENESTNDEKFNDLVFVVSNIFKELCVENNCEAEVVTVSENIFVIIKTNDCKMYENNTLNTLIENGLGFINEHFLIKLSYVLSDLYEGEGCLARAYSQCNYLLRYKSAMGIEESITSVDVQKNKRPGESTLFNTEIEQRLINTITVGNFEQAAFILNQIFADIYKNDISKNELKCLFIDIGCSIGKIPQNEIDFDKLLELSDDAIAMEEFLKETIKESCMELKSSKVGNRNKFESVVDYIDANFTEVMNLDILADKFNLSSRYLSKMFKANMQMNLPDYINKVRIAYAKTLLRETDTSVAQIAIECGCGNIRTFNRIFQKLEGVTPSEYRTNC